MDSYKIIDNKFKPGQSYPIVGNEGEVEGIIWISYIHHDFCLGLLQMCHIEVLHLIIEDPFKNQSCLPFCTTNCGTSIILQNFTSIACPPHTGHSKFPADDVSMTSPSSSGVSN